MPLIARGARLGTASLVALALLGAPLGAHAAVESPSAAAAIDGVADVVLVVPITAPLDAPAILEAELLESYTADDGVLGRRLAAAEGTNATLAIDPRILVSIRLLGSTVPEGVAEWLDRLESLPNESFLLGYADVDPAALATVDATRLGVPLDFEFAIDPGRFDPVPEDEPTPPAGPDAGPEPTDDPGATPSPTTEELRAWSSSIDALAWPAAGSLTDAGLAALVEDGIEHLLLDADELTAGSASHVELTGADAVVARGDLSALLAEADSSASSLEAGEARESLIAELAALGRSSDAPVVLTASRVASESTSRLAQLADALERHPEIRLVGISAAFAEPAIATSLAEPAASRDRAALLDEVVAAAAEESRFAAVVDDPESFRAERRLELLVALAAGRVAPAGGEELALSAFLDGSAAVTGGVQIVQGSDLLVLSNSTGLPVTVSNALDVPVTVMVSGRPLRPLLRITGGAVEVTIEPGSSHTAYLPAQAVTNGEVPVLVSLRSSSGVEIGSDRVLRVDLQAQWETVGIIILVGLGVMFGAGIVRNIVLRRRAARERDATVDDADD